MREGGRKVLLSGRENGIIIRREGERYYCQGGRTVSLSVGRTVLLSGGTENGIIISRENGIIIREGEWYHYQEGGRTVSLTGSNREGERYHYKGGRTVSLTG